MEKEIKEKLQVVKVLNSNSLHEIETEYTNDFVKKVSEQLGLGAVQSRKLSRYLKDSYSQNIKNIWGLGNNEVR